MIDNATVKRLSLWFVNYVKQFYTGNSEHNYNITMKYEHSIRVCKEIIDIGKTLSLNRRLLYVAEITALLHDIGRFEQYIRYGTFVDKMSEDHATLGIRIISEEGILDGIDDKKSNTVLSVIGYHNKVEIPSDLTGECLILAKLLRDADKIDILNVVTNYYYRENEKKNDAIELGLSDMSNVSDKIMEDIRAERVAKIEYMKTLNDLKALQMSWVFDVNFVKTFQIIKERRYLEKIRDSLSDNRKAREIYSTINSYLEKNL